MYFKPSILFGFPSPYGVIFILTIDKYYDELTGIEFPSPCRVLFILIKMKKIFEYNGNISFRLLTELYSFLHEC